MKPGQRPLRHRLSITTMTATMTATLEAKSDLRRMAQARRAEAAAAAPEAGAAVSERLCAALRVPDTAVVSGYWPMRGELDPRPALLALAAAGHPLCLPVVAGKGRPLLFRAWAPGADLVPGAFGAQVPAPESPVLQPSLLLVPLLAFDRRGYRLGYGGGFYDRTLAALRRAGAVTAVGLAFAGQEVEAVPAEATDERLDWIVTEREALSLRAATAER